MVGNDEGFHSSIEFWKERGSDVKMASNLPKQPGDTAGDELYELIPQFQDDIPVIAGCLKSCKT